jgi:hypothetical protein
MLNKHNPFDHFQKLVIYLSCEFQVSQTDNVNLPIFRTILRSPVTLIYNVNYSTRLQLVKYKIINDFSCFYKLNKSESIYIYIYIER